MTSTVRVKVNGLLATTEHQANMTIKFIIKVVYECMGTQHLHAAIYSNIYRVRQNKISQHNNCYISEMPEYFCTKFRSFVCHNTMH